MIINKEKCNHEENPNKVRQQKSLLPVIIGSPFLRDYVGCQKRDKESTCKPELTPMSFSGEEGAEEEVKEDQEEEAEVREKPLPSLSVSHYSLLTPTHLQSLPRHSWSPSLMVPAAQCFGRQRDDEEARHLRRGRKGPGVVTK